MRWHDRCSTNRQIKAIIRVRCGIHRKKQAMNAIDTNVLARFFVTDPEDAEASKQHPAAVRVMSEKVFVATSVVLEFEWVLRGFYQLPQVQISKVFEALCGLENVYIENRHAVLLAMNGYQNGLDFADALHLASAQSCEQFSSFDHKLRKKAKALGLTPLVVEPG
jgi:predicted nucleic-acid-binding protein